MNPWVLFAAVLVAVGAFFYGQEVGKDRALAKQKETADLVDAVFDKAQQGAADAIAKLKPRNVTIRQELEREIQTNTIYRDCRVPANGVRLANEALTGRPEPAGGGELPRAEPAAAGP
jgi:hypothetical protein